MEKISGTPAQLRARRKWVDALRSGKYKQATGMLRNRDNGFCCLGVACEISGLGTWRPTKQSLAMVDFEYIYSGGELSATLGLENPIEEMFGVGSEGYFGDVLLENGNSAVNLFNLNDSFHWSFDQIADFIEERWEVAPAA